MKQQFREDFTTLLNQESQIDAAGCNSITIINTGTSTVSVFGYSLAPGSQYISSGNEGEANFTQYKLQYITAGIDSITVIRKTYF
jgi:hypothetical protein